MAPEFGFRGRCLCETVTTTDISEQKEACHAFNKGRFTQNIANLFDEKVSLCDFKLDEGIDMLI